jgi:flavin reductase (DIM6/NTAB) family NADH-FMN oxidoreductase RutF
MDELTPLRRLLTRLDYPMVIVTVAVGDETSGCLVGFHTQCSVSPPRYLVCLSKRNRTYRLAERAEHLGVHFLAADQRGLAELFGGETTDEIDKLARVDHHPGAGGAPLLDAAATRFVGRVVDRFDGGDHVGFVLAPEHAEGDDDHHQLGFQDVIDLEPGHDP